jgi:DNA-directed RNA polymerase specialized sigma24 family protein
MESRNSVTQWIQQAKQGDEEAAQRLWERYYGRMVRLALRRLEGQRRRAADEEDVALSAFHSFCRGAREGRFPRLADRDNLWPLLVTITVRKANELRHYETRKKRGGGKVRGESTLEAPPEKDHAAAGLDQFPNQSPSPATAAQVAEECQRRLEALGDKVLQSVALWKLEGYTNAEIAQMLGCVEGTVERKLRTIRSCWAQEGPS